MMVGMSLVRLLDVFVSTASTLHIHGRAEK
jgi:hypothetical protein